MIQTLFDSQTVFLIDDAWNGSSPFEAEFSLIRNDEASLSRRGARRPYCATLRARLRFEVTLHNQALRRAIAGLQSLTTQPVAVPLWPVVTFWSQRATAPLSGGLKLVWKEDFSQFELFSETEPAWPMPDDFVAPVLLGFITKTEPAMLNPDAARWQIDFTESSPADYAIEPPVVVFTAGPQPAGYSFAPLLLPFQPDFSSVSEEISVDVKRDDLGFSREQVQSFYAQLPARAQTAHYTLHGSEVGNLLRFFQDVAGPGASFWATGWMQLAQITADAPETATALTVDDPAALNPGNYVSVFTGDSAVARQVTAKAGQSITLNDALGVSIRADESLLLPLSLARFAKSVLSLSWRSPEAVSCEIDWTEVPSEYIPAATETLGATLGKLKTRVVLFDFIRDLGNGSIITDHFTNFESDLIWNGQTYNSRKGLAHGDITQTLNFENTSVDLTLYHFPGNPLALDLGLKAESPLWLTIRHAEWDGVAVSNAQMVFTGELRSAARTGFKFTAQFGFGPVSLDEPLPRMIRGQMCSHVGGTNADGFFLISYGCSLLKADWQFTAKVAAPISGGYPYLLHLDTLARSLGPEPSYFVDWFALGWVEIGTGVAIQRRMILKSTNPVSGAFTIRMQRPLESLPTVGETIRLYPGCDGMFHTCKAYDPAANPLGKFNNAPNFGGEPFCPVGNPSLARLAGNPVRGAKK